MNCLIVLPNEVREGGTAIISGERATLVRGEHELVAGITVTAAVRNGRIGRALVEGVNDDEVRLKLTLDREPPLRMEADLIVAVPRPQTTKKLIHLATTLGVERVHFIRTLNTVKSYLQSSALDEGGIEVEVMKGLAQGVDSVAPQFEVHRSFERFAADVLPEIALRRATRVFADTHSTDAISSQIRGAGDGVALAIGPEAGWSDKERSAFSAAGFHGVGLGPRMLRVDTATVVALAELGIVTRKPL